MSSIGMIAELGAGAVGDVLPGDEVRVVLELGREHDVAGAEPGEPVGVGDQVEPLGGVADEDDLALAGRVDERAHLLTCALEPGRRPLAELVDAPVDVRVGGLVELRHRLEHLAGLLRGRRGVQVGERLAVKALLEDREVGAQPRGIEHRLDSNRHEATVPRRLRGPLPGDYRAATVRFRRPRRVRDAFGSCPAPAPLRGAANV